MKMESKQVALSKCLHYLVVLLAAVHTCSSVCYFPAEFQGEFLMQSTFTPESQQVQYSQVNISAESIPIWGHCHRRIGNNVILLDNFAGTNCFRCFHLNLRSRNVLQVHTEGLDKCYTNEEAAVAICPNETTVVNDHSKEILLYKTKGLGGEEIRQEYCPINGRFTFIYNVNDGTESKMECFEPVSELSNCPYGFGLNLRFRRCSFLDHEISFQCLGDWAGPGNQRYLALLTTSVGGEKRPLYRCAMYREEIGTGRIYLAFSSDSTCSSDLRSSTDGYETLVLTTVRSSGWPAQVESSSCRFPSWAYGHWENVFVDGNTLTYKDHRTFKTFTMRCIDSGPESNERFLVYGKTQCGDEMYNCVWLKKRSMNVLEFQMGLKSSPTFNSNLCAGTNFQDKIWITQGRTDILEESPCPIAGEYTGFIPDATGLCAKLYSDCNHPEIMFYTVSNCNDQSEVYEGNGRQERPQLGVHIRDRHRRQANSKIYGIKNPRPITTTTTSTTTAAVTTTIDPSIEPPEHKGLDAEAVNSDTLSNIRQSYQPPRSTNTGASYSIASTSTRFESSPPVSSELGRGSPPRPEHSYPEDRYASADPRYPTDQRRRYQSPRYPSSRYPETQVADSGRFPQNRYSGSGSPDAVYPPTSDTRYRTHFENAPNPDSRSYRPPNAESPYPPGQRNYYSGRGHTPYSSADPQVPTYASNTSSSKTAGPYNPVPRHPSYAGSPYYPPRHARPQYYGQEADSRHVDRSSYGDEETGNITESPNPILTTKSWEYSEEAYDPWAFPKTHGQTGSQISASSAPVPSVPRPVNSTAPQYHPPQSQPTWAENRRPDDRRYPYYHQQPPAVPPPATVSTQVRRPGPAPNDEQRNYNHQDPQLPTAASRNSYSSKTQERQYRCLGQWEEDGVMYTYTQRRDVGGYECFVGSIVSNSEIYIKEAGEHCQRGMEPLNFGMKLTKKGSCFGPQSTSSSQSTSIPPPHTRPTSSWYSSKRPPEPTKPWKPITGPPRGNAINNSSPGISSTATLTAMAIVFLILSSH